jgi:hypothetical protein
LKYNQVITAFKTLSMPTILLLLASHLGQEPVALSPSGRFVHKPLAEISGIAKSRSYPDTYWVHNDGGDSPRIFAVHGDGRIIMPSWLSDKYYVDTPLEGKREFPGIEISSATNIDWEDIALDDDKIYIADCGNNGNARRDLGIYLLQEPNPTATDRCRALKWIPVAFPDQKAFPGKVWRFDCEALFVYRHKLYFLTKHRAGAINKVETGTKLYRLDTQFPDRVNMLKLVDAKSDMGGWVTAADLSPDGRTLAVLAQYPEQSVWLFDTPRKGDRFLSSPSRRLRFSGGKQCEAICFVDNHTLLIANEQRDIFTLPIPRQDREQ